MTFAILPHPKAPDFSLDANPSLLLEHCIAEMSSPNMSTAERILDLLRQAALVNLFFHLKFVLGASHDYSYLESGGLQEGLCNFRQSEACMVAGARAAICMARGFSKTDIGDTGATDFELARNPDLAVMIASARAEKAEEFVQAIRDPFDNNAVYKEFWPELCPKVRPALWSNHSFVLPGRKRHRSVPSVFAVGVTGATEGYHPDLVIADDIIGLDDMTPDNLSSVTMLKKKTWLDTSLNAHKASMKSRYIMLFTTFGADDVYQEIFKNLGSLQGYDTGEYCVGGTKKWSLYLRSARENGKVTLPAVIDAESLDSLRSTNPQVYFSQYEMLPQDAGSLEFHDLELRKAVVYVRDEEFLLDVPFEPTPEEPEGEPETLSLGSLDVIGSLDPAGTDKGVTSRTSKSAFQVWAKDWKERCYLLWESAGYFAPQETFDEIARAVKYFRGLMRSVYVEEVALQKILLPILKKERDLYWDSGYVRFEGHKVGKADKDARIRHTVGHYAARDKLYVVAGVGSNFVDEFGLFPNARWKKDSLNAAEIALANLRTPLAPEDEADWEDLQGAFTAGAGRNRITGY